ncbi:MAG: ribonuclease Y [bacterium]|nr:ribonuclease Y [bacterium]
MFGKLFSFFRKAPKPQPRKFEEPFEVEQRKQRIEPRVKPQHEPRVQQVAQNEKQARNEAAEIVMEAKQEAIEIRRRVDEDTHQEKQRLAQLEERVIQREERIAVKLDEMEAKARRLQEKIKAVQEKEASVDQLYAEEQQKLSEVAQLSPMEAEKKVLFAAEERTKVELVRRMRKLEEVGRDEWEKRANNLLAQVVQRYAASQVSETTTSVVHLADDTLKGRIIGKEGRNIKVLETITGCEILVDETPGTIVVSGFSPLRRQIAKVSIERLIEDGRIQPARIEEVVAKAKKDIAKNVMEAGEEVVYDLGITDFHPNLVQLIGRLKFRTSYGQSILQHSWEAARIATMLCEELGGDVNITKRATLLHDIGKAVDHEVEGNHVEIGINIMKKFSIPEAIIKAAAAHHDSYPFETMEALIVQVADAISASRPGARRESYELYVKRMEDLERLAQAFDGVQKVYAISAGREVRVFVQPEKVDDLSAIKLAQDIAAKIEQELEYPGDVKVNVVRELRAEAIAK